LGSVSSLVSEKNIFEISANQSIFLALAAMLKYLVEIYSVSAEKIISDALSYSENV
jgi:hypothetical protein